MSEGGSDDEDEAEQRGEGGNNELEYDDMFLRDNDFGSDCGSDGEEMAKVAMRIREGDERLGCRYITSALLLTHNNHAEGGGGSGNTTMCSESSAVSGYNSDHLFFHGNKNNSSVSGNGSSVDNNNGVVMYDTEAKSSFRYNAEQRSHVVSLQQMRDQDTARLSSYTAAVYTSAINAHAFPYLGGNTHSTSGAVSKKTVSDIPVVTAVPVANIATAMAAAATATATTMTSSTASNATTTRFDDTMVSQ